MARLESCPTCGNQTSENANQCPDCGEPLSPGWADTVREQREQKAEEANRAAGQAFLVQKKAKRKKRLIWVSIFAVLIAWIIGTGMYDDYELRNLKETNPAEYQKRIQNIEAQAAKVKEAEAEAKAAKAKARAKAEAEAARKDEEKAATLAAIAASKWYNGGTLHRANLASWSNSTNKNRLATSADFAAKMLEGRFSSMDALKIHARNLKICVDEVAVEPKIGAMRVSEVAASCAILLGWQN